MGVIIILIILALVWLLFEVKETRKEAKLANDEVKGLLGRVRDLQRDLMAVKQALVPAASATQTDADRLRTEFEEHRQEVLIDEVVAEPVDIDELLKNLEVKRRVISEAHAPPPLPMKVEFTEQETLEKLARPVVTEPKELFSLERFMGVKLFAWLGGVAMFFGVIFFVKYAFEKNLIPPAVRIAMGFMTGTGMLVGGLWAHRLARYRVLAQAFCATGVLILYGVTFAAHAIYHFEAFGSVPTFVVMSLVTLVAFLVAVRLNALVVAVLGMLGGFLTPVLVSTGHDQVFGLFGYIALLDIGLVAVSRHGRWRFLTSAAAAGTVMMQIGWAAKFFASGHYDVGSKTLIPLGIALFFIAVFLIGGWVGKQGRELAKHSTWAVLGLSVVAIVFAFWLLGFEQVAKRYFLLYGYIFLVQLGVMAVVLARPQVSAAQLVAAGLAFLHLACWTTGHLTAENLHRVLVIYLVFGALHAVAPVLLFKRFPATSATLPLKAGPWIAPLVLLLMLLPVFYLSPVSMTIWVAILILDLMAIGLAVVTGGMLSLLVSLALTMVAAALWLLKGPSNADSLLPFLGVITGFSAVFSVGGMLLARLTKVGKGRGLLEIQAAAVLPICSALLPFGMLILAVLHLPVPSPAAVFGVALVMSVLLAGLAVLGKQGSLVLAALAGTLAVEAVWHVNHFEADSPMVALPWYLGFYGLFLLFPFIFRKACAGQAAPWIGSALAGVGHFLLVHHLVKCAFPNGMMGLLPAAFAVPALAALFAVIRSTREMDARSRSQLAWFGGVALFFITLIFPIQFSRQWLTVSWALEGALLLWLFRRVTHPGLQLTGLALLSVAFFRLTLNPAVFTDYPRSGTVVFNWHLYAYGLVAAAQFLGAGWFIDPAGRCSKFPARGLLHGFGGVLLFLLLNIEIANYFTSPGDRCVAFMFGGNFARDMTYSIAWGLFSLGLLGIGIWKASRHARYAAIGLLVVTLIKLFFHDLAAIENIFRVGALIGVAVIAFMASFIYQRFFDRNESL